VCRRDLERYGRPHALSRFAEFACSSIPRPRALEHEAKIVRTRAGESPRRPAAWVDATGEAQVHFEGGYPEYLVERRAAVRRGSRVTSRR
jgi:hypothetical protein